VVSTPVTGTASEYINTYKDLAVKEMKRTGVPASITLAQGMLESDYGRSTLARSGNNHFGIKCHNGWTGPSIRKHDDRRNECFRKYKSTEESYRDHSDFLRTGSRYSFLFSLDPSDYKGWARGLKKAGYATDPKYADLLIRKIEEYSLYNFDRGYSVASVKTQEKAVAKTIAPAPVTRQSAAPPPVRESEISFGDVMARVPRVMENNRIQYIIVKDGDTKEKIEKEFNLLKWELARYNEVKEDFVLFPGQVLYLQTKRDKAEAGNEFYIAAAGDTMYMISQKYGIKLKSLLEMNRMGEGKEPVAGQKIWLQNVKPAN